MAKSPHVKLDLGEMHPAFHNTLEWCEGIIDDIIKTNRVSDLLIRAASGDTSYLQDFQDGDKMTVMSDYLRHRYYQAGWGHVKIVVRRGGINIAGNPIITIKVRLIANDDLNFIGRFIARYKRNQFYKNNILKDVHAE